MGKTKSGTLHGKVASEIRALIDHGELRGGDKIPELELCQRFGVSRTPLREALKVLAYEGFVELMPNRGARVKRITKKTLKDTFSVMGALEGLAGEQAVYVMTEKQVAEVEAMHHKMMSHYIREEMEDYLEENRKIHDAIVKGSGNEILFEMYANLSVRVKRLRFKSEIGKDYWSKAVKEHEAMIKALKKRDGNMLGDILRKHLEDKVSISIFGRSVERSN